MFDEFLSHFYAAAMFDDTGGYHNWLIHPRFWGPIAPGRLCDRSLSGPSGLETQNILGLVGFQNNEIIGETSHDMISQYIPMLLTYPILNKHVSRCFMVKSN